MIQISKENFDTYSITSTNFTNVKPVEIISIPFSITKTPTISTERFELVGVYDGAYICLDGQNSIGYIYQNGQNGVPTEINLNYVLTANGYGTVASGTNLPITSNCENIPLTIDKAEAMKTQLGTKDENSGDTLSPSAWVFGSKSTIDGTLSYTATSTKSDNPNKILNKKDIKVYFVTSSNCNQLKVDTSKLSCNTALSVQNIAKTTAMCNTATQNIPCNCNNDGTCTDIYGKQISGLVSTTPDSSSGTNTNPKGTGVE